MAPKTKKTISSPLVSALNNIVSINRSGSTMKSTQQSYQGFLQFMDVEIRNIEGIKLPKKRDLQKLSNLNVAATFGSAGSLLSSLASGALDAQDVEDFQGHKPAALFLVSRVFIKQFARKSDINSAIGGGAQDIFISLERRWAKRKSCSKIETDEDLKCFISRHFILEEQAHVEPLICLPRNESGHNFCAVYRYVVERITRDDRLPVAVEVLPIVIVVQILFRFEHRHAEPTLDSVDELAVQHEIRTCSIP